MKVTDEHPDNSAKEFNEKQVKRQLIAKHNEEAIRSTDFPTELIDLPSKGLFYPKNHPLSSGKIEMKYMTAKEEDILTSQNLIKQGVVLDKLFQSLIVTPINYDDLLVGDKNAIMLAARVLGYGKEYSVDIKCKSCVSKNKLTIDLTSIEDKDISNVNPINTNEFEYKLPHSKRTLTFQFMTVALDKAIQSELKGLRQISKKSGIDSELTTRLKHLILTIDGNSDKAAIRHFVDNEFLAIDSRAFRSYIQQIQPDIDLSLSFDCSECDAENNDIDIPITVNFFWPGL